MFRQIGPPEILIILGVVLLLFGGKKLPELARGSGKALRIFKTEVKALHDDDDDDPATPTTKPAAIAQPETIPAAEADKKREQG
jgi:sec-independent protein translocase protein TatA